MADATKLWKQDSDGPYIDMRVGQKKEIGVNLADFWPNTETLATATWSGPAEITFSAGGIAGLQAKRSILATAVGEHACLVVCSSGSGGWVEPIPFKVIVK